MSGLKLIDDTQSLSHEELASLKKLARMYSAGKIIGGGVVFLAGIATAAFEIIHFFSRH